MFPVSLARGVSSVAASFSFFRGAGLRAAAGAAGAAVSAVTAGQAPQPGAPFTITGRSVAPEPSSPWPRRR